MIAESTGPDIYEALPPQHPQGPRSNRVAARSAGGRWRASSSFEHHRLGSDSIEYSGLQINMRNRNGLYSWHAGVNVAMCDGAVSFKPEGTHPEVMLVLLSRAGGANELVQLRKYNPIGE